VNGEFNAAQCLFRSSFYYTSIEILAIGKVDVGSSRLKYYTGQTGFHRSLTVPVIEALRSYGARRSIP